MSSCENSVKGLSTASFYAQTMPGFEQVAWREIQSFDNTAECMGFRTCEDKNGLVLFEYHRNPGNLLHLRTTEDVFFFAGWARHVPLDRSGLEALRELVETAKYFDIGLRIHREVRREKGRATFRVIARKQGGSPSYRRVDVQRAIEKGVLARYNNKWKVVEDGAAIEVWVTLLGTEVIVGLRLSDQSMRHRTYKIRHLAASLRPTVAAAMVFLSTPQPSDVFLDPMCGAGTILIERALAGPYTMLLGGDSSEQAIEVCQANVGTQHQSLEIRHWDASGLPLPDASVDKVVSNLPFGEQIGSHEENSVLYPAFFVQMLRVVRPGGRLVLLTGERALMRQILSSHPELHVQQAFGVQVLGMAATVYVLDRL